MAAAFIEDTLRADARARVLLCATQDTAKDIRDRVSGEYHDRFHRAQGDKSRGKMFTHVVVVDDESLEENELVVRFLVRGFGVSVTRL
jgi:hypothetical protein